jgi:hypothetical protein
MKAPESGSVTRARIGIVQSILLLVAAVVPWPACWNRVRGALDSARSPEMNRAEREGHAAGYAAGYYEGLIGGNSRSAEGSRGDPALRLTGKPTGWVSFREADVVKYLDDDFLQFELKPQLERNLFGQPFLTNAFGMHDDPISLEKPKGTVRVAVLGSSMDMGWGVRYQETYINTLEQWLKNHAARHHLSPATNFEVLNFAVAAYSPMQRLDVLRRKVLAFQPDLVIYSATTLDLRLMEIHLCDIFRKNVDLKYDFIKEFKMRAEIDSDDVRLDRDGDLMNKDRLKKKLRPLYWSLYDVTLSAIAGECRAAGVPLVMVIIPRVGKADSPALRAEPVARLRALAAHQGLTVFDLSDTFDQLDSAKLEIAAWDDHPNAIGHHRLFLALARALVKDHEIYRLLFSADRPQQLGTPLPQTLAGKEKASLDSPCVPPLGAASIPRLDKIWVWDQDDSFVRH